jgi:uncharacterized protein
MKQQILVVHGGGSFLSRRGEVMLDIIAAKEPNLEYMRRSVDWKATLQEKLGDAYDVLAPRMPNADAPRYDEWKLWFEKILPLLDESALFVGHSLGGMFLAKYFSESPLREYATAVFLVAPPFGTLGHGWEFLSIEKLPNHAHATFIYHSKDDEVVPFTESQQFKTALPGATVRELDGRGHFNKDDFPEIVEDIRNLSV